jgi:hypothetical protein
MRKILLCIIAIAVLTAGLLSGCTVPTYNFNNFTVRLHSVDVHLFTRPYLEIWFYLNISDYKGEKYRLGSLTYTINGNSHCLCEREIFSFSDGNTSLRSACEQFEDSISLDGLTINQELHTMLMNEQPIRWSVSGELTLYDEYKLTGVNSVLKVPFDGLIYRMTTYS